MSSRAHTCFNQLCLSAAYVSSTTRVTCLLVTGASGRVELITGVCRQEGDSVLDERLRRAIALEDEAGFGFV